MKYLYLKEKNKKIKGKWRKFNIKKKEWKKNVIENKKKNKIKCEVKMEKSIKKMEEWNEKFYVEKM
jgi:hypothetical protein